MFLHRLSFLFVLALSAGCLSEEIVPATQVVAVVNSDLEIGRALTTIKVMVQTADGLATVAEPAPFVLAVGGETTAGKVALPLSFGITKPKAGADTFRLVVAGYGPLGPGGSEIKVIEQRVLASFQDGRTLRATIFLGSACFQKLCDAAPGEDQVCYVAALGTISTGACGPIQTPALETVKPSEELVDVAWPVMPTMPVTPDSPRAAQRQTIGPAGGTIRNQRVSVFVPPGALTSDVEMSLEPSMLQSDTAIEAWQIAPSGTVLSKPATVTFSYQESELAGQPATDFAVATFVEGRWQPLDGAQYDAGARTIGGATTRLSTFAVTRRGSDPNDCPAGACANGLCVDGAGTYTCTCSPGFVVDATQHACSNVNDCQPGLCANGSCVDGVNDYTCQCNVGTTGTGTKSCTGEDNCRPGYCMDGTCIDGDNDYRCSCNRGFTYEPSTHRCVNPNNCPTSGCLNGTCVDGLDDYSCNCNQGYQNNGPRSCVARPPPGPPPGRIDSPCANWIETMMDQPRPAGVLELALENTSSGPVRQYLCRSTPGGPWLPGKFIPYPVFNPQGTNSPCNIAMGSGTSWTSSHAPYFQAFAPAPGCSAVFRPTSTSDPAFPTGALPIAEASGGPVYVCRATVTTSGPGSGTHLGHVSAGTGKVCRIEFYEAVREFTSYEVLVVSR